MLVYRRVASVQRDTSPPTVQLPAKIALLGLGGKLMRACRRLRNSSAPSAALLQTIGRPQTLSMTRSKGSFTAARPAAAQVWSQKRRHCTPTPLYRARSGARPGRVQFCPPPLRAAAGKRLCGAGGCPGGACTGVVAPGSGSPPKPHTPPTTHCQGGCQHRASVAGRNAEAERGRSHAISHTDCHQVSASASATGTRHLRHAVKCPVRGIFGKSA